MSPISFIATLFCTAAATLLIGGMEIAEWVDFRLNETAAEMTLADPGKKLTLPQGGLDIHLVDVRYRGPAGELLVPQKRLSRSVALQLADGKVLPIIYYRNNPQRQLLRHQEPPALPWAWLGLSAALWATFVFAVRLRRAELQASEHAS